MSDGKVVDIILHCQKQIKKQGLTEEKLLHYLGRLSRLRVTVQDLADTGIGRTVNSLSRNEGPVGRAAETLVRGWKRMVSEQQTQAEPEESEDDSGSNSGSSEDEEEEEEEEEVNNEENQPYEVEDQEEAQQDRRYSNGHQNYEDCRSTSETQPMNRNRDYDEEDDDDDIDDPYMNEDGGFLDMSKVQADVDDDEEDVDDKDSDSVGSERLEIDADEDDEPSHDHRDDKPSSSSVSAKHLERHQPDDREPRSSQSSKSSSSASSSQKSLGNDPKMHSGSSSSSSKSHRSLERSNERSHSKEHKHHHHRSSSKELSSKEHTKQSSSNADQHSSKHSKSHHHHSSSSKPEKVKESKIEGEKSHHHNHKDKDKHHRVKETSSNSHSHHREKESKSEKSSSSSRDKKDSSEHRSSSSGHHKDKTREPSSSSSTNSPKKSSLDSVKKEELVHKSRDDRKRKEHSSNSPSESSASKKSKLVLKDEIDSNSGINFADVLGSLDVSSSSSKPSSSKKDHKRREEPEKSHRSSKHDSHHSHSSSSRKHDKHSSSSRDAGSSSSVSSSSKKYESPSKKSIPQSKIESVIQPVVNISPHYKPSVAKLGRSAVVSSSTNGNGIVAPPPLSISPVDLIQDLGTVDYWENGGQSGSGQMSQEDAISTMLSSRNARSKVFSGNKSTRRGEVTSLYDLCMQVIKDNIGELGYTGGIPYEILKPALERANPQQLMNIESQNDYLIGETDELWQFHCKRDFRGKVPAETESWRELYERCTEERQLKFEVIKKQMKKSLEKAEPQRKAKLAYVDTTSTTRFNRQKAQTIKNGMKTLKIKEEKGPSRGVASSASAGFNNPKKSSEMHFEEAAVIIAPESRAGHAPAPSVSREASAAKLKPKKAPLMQKTMKLIKSLHRR